MHTVFCFCFYNLFQLQSVQAETMEEANPTKLKASAAFFLRSTRPVTWRLVQRWRGTHLGHPGCPSMSLREELVKSRGCATCAEPTCLILTSCRLDGRRWRRASVLTMAPWPVRQIVSWPLLSVEFYCHILQYCHLGFRRKTSIK